ncbi:MAG: hypothetical protein ACJAYX_000142, partial [Planctomycetota bacterium]
MPGGDLPDWGSALPDILAAELVVSFSP